MKKFIVPSILGVLLFTALSLHNMTPKAWADTSGLSSAVISKANYLYLQQCTTSGGVIQAGTCSTAGINWNDFSLWLGNNINWQDLPGVTGAPTSIATWVKTTAP